MRLRTTAAGIPRRSPDHYPIGDGKLQVKVVARGDKHTTISLLYPVISLEKVGVIISYWEREFFKESDTYLPDSLVHLIADYERPIDSNIVKYRFSISQEQVKPEDIVDVAMHGHYLYILLKTGKLLLCETESDGGTISSLKQVNINNTIQSDEGIYDNIAITPSGDFCLMLCHHYFEDDNEPIQDDEIKTYLHYFSTKELEEGKTSWREGMFTIGDRFHRRNYILTTYDEGGKDYVLLDLPQKDIMLPDSSVVHARSPAIYPLDELVETKNSEPKECYPLPRIITEGTQQFVVRRTYQVCYGSFRGRSHIAAVVTMLPLPYDAYVDTKDFDRKKVRLRRRILLWHKGSNEDYTAFRLRGMINVRLWGNTQALCFANTMLLVGAGYTIYPFSISIDSSSARITLQAFVPTALEERESITQIFYQKRSNYITIRTGKQHIGYVPLQSLKAVPLYHEQCRKTPIIPALLEQRRGQESPLTLNDNLVMNLNKLKIFSPQAGYIHITEASYYLFVVRRRRTINSDGDIKTRSKGIIIEVTIRKAEDGTVQGFEEPRVIKRQKFVKEITQMAVRGNFLYLYDHKRIYHYDLQKVTSAKQFEKMDQRSQYDYLLPKRLYSGREAPQYETNSYERFYGTWYSANIPPLDAYRENGYYNLLLETNKMIEYGFGFFTLGGTLMLDTFPESKEEDIEAETYLLPSIFVVLPDGKEHHITSTCSATYVALGSQSCLFALGVTEHRTAVCLLLWSKKLTEPNQYFRCTQAITLCETNSNSYKQPGSNIFIKDENLLINLLYGIDNQGSFTLNPFDVKVKHGNVRLEERPSKTFSISGRERVAIERMQYDSFRRCLLLLYFEGPSRRDTCIRAIPLSALIERKGDYQTT